MNIFKSKGSDKDASLSLEDEDAKDFMEYLKEAQETDLREIERTGCVSQGRDMRNGNVIVMIPSLGLNRMERPEQMFRKMLLLFLLKTHEMVGTAYSVVYAHTTIDIINQYPLIYKFYSILPRFYKKNLQKMYIIHPNIGIRAFFEFARIFLSHKFYNKLCLLESVLDFQRIIFPTQLPLPLKFLRKEDDEREVKYFGPLPSVRQSYINSLGTMEVLWICAEFLRENKGYQSPGIFRVPGDEGEISLAKVRLQYGYNVEDTQNGWISLSENKKYIVIGNINDLYGESTSSSAASATEAASQIQPTHASGTASGSSSAHASLSLTRKPSRTLSTSQSQTAANLSTSNVAVEVDENGSPTLSIVILNNTYTVAELFKLSIRELSEPLVLEEITQDLLTLTRVYGSRPLDLVWEKAVAQRLADLPLSNLSTLIFIVRFLRDVGAESAHNNMDTKNLSLVFAPTIFRFAMTDLIAATVDIKLIQSVMREIIERPTLLQYAVRFFRESYTRRRTAGSEEVGNVDESEEIDFNEMEQLLRVNPFLLSSEMTLTLPELTATAAAAAAASPTISSPPATEELISSGLSPAMVARMNRSANTRRVSSKDDDEDETPNDTEEASSDGAFSRKLDGDDLGGPIDVVEEAFNACTNNRYFAMGRNRDLSTSGMASGGGIMERDMGDNATTTSSSSGSGGGSGGRDSMRGRAIPPVPPPRQMPPLPATAATSHESDTDEVDSGRGAVVLNGQVDREALRLLDDLHLTEDQSKR